MTRSTGDGLRVRQRARRPAGGDDQPHRPADRALPAARPGGPGGDRAPATCASRDDEAARPAGRGRAEPARRRRSPACASAPRAGRPASTWRGCRCAGARTRRRFIADFAGDDRLVVDYLADEVLEGLPRRAPRVPAADLGAGPALGPAVRRRCRHERVGAGARRARALQPLPGAARQPARVVPLPPPLRRAAAARARTDRARRGGRAAPARGRLAPGRGLGGRRRPPRGRRGRPRLRRPT